jgi:hypothetical protein
MAIYKVSYVILGDDQSRGMILNQDHLPQRGERVVFEQAKYEVLDVLELAPPRGEFHYIHVTCKRVK